MSRPAVWLLAGFGLLGAALVGMALLNPNRFTSVDSHYYLQSAANLLTGRGYVVPDGNRLVWNGLFPIGYPAVIAALSGLTGLPVLVASKLINYGAVGLSGRAWIRRLGPERAGWVVSVWALGSFLKILAYTWSETVFLVLLVEWVWCLHRFLTKPTGRQTLTLLLISVSLFLVRYVGGYVFGLMGLLAIVGWRKPNWLQTQLGLRIERQTPRRLLLISVTGIVMTGLYFWMNRQFSDSAFGGARFLPTESASELACLFARSIGNEWLLIRDFVVGEPNGLAWLGVGLQTLLIGVFYVRVRRQPMVAIPSVSPLSRLFILTGLVYVVVLFTVRIVSPFSGPNGRLMAPATFCLLTSGLLWVSAFPPRWQRLIRPFWLTLLLCSWLQLLPQVDLNQKLNRLWNGLMASIPALHNQ